MTTSARSADPLGVIARAPIEFREYLAVVVEHFVDPLLYNRELNDRYFCFGVGLVFAPLVVSRAVIIRAVDVVFTTEERVQLAEEVKLFGTVKHRYRQLQYINTVLDCTQRVYLFGRTMPSERRYSTNSSESFITSLIIGINFWNFSKIVLFIPLYRYVRKV